MCKKTEKFWKEIQAEIPIILKLNLFLKSETMLLVILSWNIDRSLHERLRYVFTAARATLASRKKAEELPAMEHCKNALAECATMAKLIYYINKRPIKESEKKVLQTFFLIKNQYLFKIYLLVLN